MLNALIAYILASVPAITNIVGTRIYPVRIPEGGVTFPALVIQQISERPIYALDGPSNCYRPRLQFSCCGFTYTDAKNLAAAVAAPAADGGLDGLTVTTGGIVIQGMHKVDESDSFDAPQNANDVARYSTDVDFYVWFNK